MKVVRMVMRSLLIILISVQGFVVFGQPGHQDLLFKLYANDEVITPTSDQFKVEMECPEASDWITTRQEWAKQDSSFKVNLNLSIYDFVGFDFWPGKSRDHNDIVRSDEWHLSWVPDISPMFEAIIVVTHLESESIMKIFIDPRVQKLPDHIMIEFKEGSFGLEDLVN